MHLLGATTFVVAGALVALLVWSRSLRDRGGSERRALLSRGTSVWEWFARFEQRGGRVQDLEGRSDGDVLRHWSVAWRASGELILALGITGVCFALGWSWWIPLVAVMAVTVVGNFVAEFYVYLVDPLTGDEWKYADAKRSLLLGLALKGAVFCTGLAGLWAAASFADSGLNLPAVLLVAGGVAVIDRCHLPARAIEIMIRSRQQAEFAGTTTESSILYLRSFDDDTARIFAPAASSGWYAPLIPQMTRFEELVETWTFGQADQLVAIGRPGERRPSLGAERTYWTDETWQDAVSRTAARCRAVILVGGTSAGLGWEIAQLASMGVLGKTLLLLPPDTPESTRNRYDRIAAATGRQDVLVEETLALSAIPALGYTPEGDLVHYVSFGRDWAAYVLAQHHLLNTILRRGDFEAADNLTQLLDLTDDPVAQARYAALRIANHDLSRSLLDEALTKNPAPGDVRDRLHVARAATDLAAGYDRSRVREHLLSATAPDGSADGSHLVLRACELLGQASTTAEDLFRLILPEALWDSGPQRRREKVPFRVRVKYQLLMARAASQQERGEHEDAIESLRAARALVKEAGLKLAVALADADITEELVALDRTDEARALATEILVRDLPHELKFGPLRATAADVRDQAAGVLFLLLNANTAADRGERILLLERQRSWRAAEGLRREAAQTAQSIALWHVKGRDVDEARRWADIAQREFAALGLLGEQAQTLTIRARAAIAAKQWSLAITDAREALAIADANGFDEIRGDPLFVIAQVAAGQARLTGAVADQESAVVAIERSLEHGKINRFPGSREDSLLVMIAHQYRALGRHQDALDAQQRAVVSHMERYGPDHLRTLRSRLYLARSHRDAGAVREARQAVEDILSRLSRVDRSPDPELRAQALTTLAHLAETSHDVDGALGVLAELEDELTATVSRTAGVRDRSLAVGVLLRAGRGAEALAVQRTLVGELSRLTGEDAPEMHQAVEDRNAIEWYHCLSEAGALQREGDHHGATVKYRQWLHERSDGGANDRVRELSCAVHIGRSLSRAGDHEDADRLLREARRDTVAELGRSAGVSLDALAERARARARAGDRPAEISCLEELHDVEVEAFGEDSKEALGTLSWLAQSHAQAGHSAEAARYADRAVAGCIARWGEDDPYTREIRDAVNNFISEDLSH